MTSAFIPIALIVIGLLSYRHSLRVKGNHRLWEQTAYLLAGAVGGGVGAAWLLFLTASAAFASTGELPAPSIDLTEILLTIVGLVASAIAAIGGFGIRFLARYLERKTGLEIDAHTREYLEQAFGRAITWATIKASDLVQSNAPSIEIHNQTVALAADYLLDRVPDALEHFGITEASLRNMIEARMLAIFGEAAIDGVAQAGSAATPSAA